MIIRSYTSRDHAACIELFNGNTPKYFDPSELTDFESWLRGQDDGKLAYKQTGEEFYFVVEIENKIVACGGFYIPKEGFEASLTWGMVASDRHRQGLGKTLLLHRIQEIETHFPQYSIVLDTTQFSYPFFEKHGFRITKITPDFYGQGMDRYDMIR